MGTTYFPPKTRKHLKNSLILKSVCCGIRSIRLKDILSLCKQTNVKWNITDAFPNGGDMDKVFPPEQELKDIYHYNGNTYGVRQAMGQVFICVMSGGICSCFLC